MSDNILDDLRKIFEITHHTDIVFKDVMGLTFAFQTNIDMTKSSIISAEIRPLGIIYKENEDYYFAPLDRTDNIEEIIKEYVKIIPEEECSHFQQ